MELLVNGIKETRDKLKRLEKLEVTLCDIVHSIEALEKHSPVVEFAFGDGSNMRCVPTDAGMRSAIGRELDRMKKDTESEIRAVLDGH